MQQAVIVYLRLSDNAIGSPGEREVLFALQEKMMQAISDSGAGEFDGDMWGEGECVLYMYGPDANRLFAVVEPLLKSCPLASGGFAVMQYGEATDTDALEVRVEW
jgi:hypothetical protein